MKRQAPLSVEDIVKRQQDSENAKKKPKFISKKERERLQREKSAADQAPLAHHSPALTADPAPETAATEQNSSNGARAKAPKKKLPARSFKFEWDADEDTMQGDDYLYSSPNADPNDTIGTRPLGQGAEIRRQRQQMLQQQNAKRDDSSLGKGWWEKSLNEMTARDWRTLKDDFEISTTGTNVPNPLRYWKESSLPRTILDTIDKLGYVNPSKVQRAAIPIALKGRDVLAVAETGSGKTAAFVIPMLTYIQELPPLTEATKEQGPYAIVLAPTRELALQIEVEARKFCQPMGFNIVSMVGGRASEEQAWKMETGAEVVVATPGRLLDNLEKRILVLSQCCYVVMDEADRMISMGFEEQVNSILDRIPVSNIKPADPNEGYQLSRGNKYRQTMMFTATLPPAIGRMAETYLRQHVTVAIGETNTAAERVEQRIELIDEFNDRTTRLMSILRSGKFTPPVIVFMNHQRSCDEVATQLNQLKSHKAVVLHGRKKQEDRETALRMLRNGDATVLVATDVAGRGIDVPDVSLVVNFQMSKDLESYTHRIGRTGRAGKKGTAITFIGKSDNDDKLNAGLLKMLQESKATKVPEDIRRRLASRVVDTRIKD